MSLIYALLDACQVDPDSALRQTTERIALWDSWIAPLPGASATGEDPGYDDDFQAMREEVNKLSGANTELVCQLAEKVLTTAAKDIRVATYYCWAKLHQEGEPGLAAGLELLAGLLTRFGTALHPQRERSRKAALEWLASARMLDSLSLYPEVVREEAQRTAGALLAIDRMLGNEPEASRPQLGSLLSALETRLVKSGGMESVVPQTVSDSKSSASPMESCPPALNKITSGQDLLTQGRTLAAYLREQPGGWLAAHHLMKSLRHDTLTDLPALTADGRTRIDPPKADQKALLRRLYLQQSWSEILEQADSQFARGASHLWLDLQWYMHQALVKSGQQALADIIAADLKGLLTRLRGLETLAFSDGTPFADEVTRRWLEEEVLLSAEYRDSHVVSAVASESDSDILSLEPEAIALADSDGPDAALGWLQTRPGIVSGRQRWLLRLLMARMAEQYGKNELAVHLLASLGEQAAAVTLATWEPELLFEVRARHLKLLRMRAGRSEADKVRLSPVMEALLAGLIAIDPARAAVLCG